MDKNDSDNRKFDDEFNEKKQDAEKSDNATDSKVKRKIGNTPDPPIYYPLPKTISEKDLDDYLAEEGNYEIYSDLTEGNNKDVFADPLVFFHLFEEQLEFFIRNQKPISLVKNINDLSINDYQKRILFYHIQDSLSLLPDYSKNDSMNVCQRLAKKEFNKLDEKLFPKAESDFDVLKNEENYFGFDFDLVKEHLKTLGYSEQILYLIEARAEYEQNKSLMPSLGITFDELCESEIKKVKSLQELQDFNNKAHMNELEQSRMLFNIPNLLKKTSNIPESIEKQYDDDDKLQYDFNSAHKVQAILYLLQGTGVNIHAQGSQAEIARFIRAIIEQNYKNIYDLVRNSGESENKKKETYKKELRKVRDKFLRLKSNAERAIQNDLERLERKNDK